MWLIYFILFYFILFNFCVKNKIENFFFVLDEAGERKQKFIRKF